MAALLKKWKKHRNQVALKNRQPRRPRSSRTKKEEVGDEGNKEYFRKLIEETNKRSGL
jgi:hypothetical protein